MYTHISQRWCKSKEVVFGNDKGQRSQGSPRAWQAHLLVGEKMKKEHFPSNPRTPSLPASHRDDGSKNSI